MTYYIEMTDHVSSSVEPRMAHVSINGELCHELICMGGMVK